MLTEDDEVEEVHEPVGTMAPRVNRSQSRKKRFPDRAPTPSVVVETVQINTMASKMKRSMKQIVTGESRDQDGEDGGDGGDGQ